ncbi:PREDICTED: uncharacterized protein LOC105316531 isoform X2 [Amphimedon queenslandica]|uniref:Uncharacterized protein n=1 Tax=Amphimedon queenslandica TaxID=400682 RepID=A0A1X7VMJ8_AMPQE|nr:PREDICTED: uncharacterized protein LOC105316531 isoform X2 [Amphimedon queenslandica]|eukprot:XP_019864230.1 PREDICTED: uncharacterized protein LOC105316531 isoform X2 [Amphimedon queenslandica]
MPCLLLLMDNPQERTMMAASDNRVATEPLGSSPAKERATTTTRTSYDETVAVAIKAAVPPVLSEESLVTGSAFEITSISQLPEDNDDSHLTVSKDQEELQKSLLEVGRSSNHLSTSSTESEPDDVPIAAAPGAMETVNASTRQHIDASLPINPSPKSDIAVPSNGPAAPQSRFRRVNHYVRGRWKVRDSFEPEERPESEMKMAPSRIVSDPNTTSPSVARKTTHQLQNKTSLSSVEHSESDDISELPQVATSGTATESIHSLSRTGSMSSVRELGPHEDAESMGSMPMCGPTPDIQPTSSLLYRPTLLCHCDECSGPQDKSPQEFQHTLEAAVCHLQCQISLFQQAASNKLLQERNKLFKENERLKEQMHLMEQELEQLKSRHTDNPPTSSP